MAELASLAAGERVRVLGGRNFEKLLPELAWKTQNHADKSQMILFVGLQPKVSWGHGGNHRRDLRPVQSAPCNRNVAQVENNEEGRTHELVEAKQPQPSSETACRNMRVQFDDVATAGAEPVTVAYRPVLCILSRYTCICMCMYIHVCMCIYIYVCIFDSTCIYIYTYIHIHTCMYTYLFTDIHLYCFLFVCFHFAFFLAALLLPAAGTWKLPQPRAAIGTAPKALRRKRRAAPRNPGRY